MSNKFACAALVLAGAAPLQAQAALDYFLKIPGAAGESNDSKHKSEIEVMSWAWGVSRSDTGSVFAPFSWEQEMDASFVPLFLGLVNDTSFSNAVLTARTAGSQGPSEFFKMTLSDVHVASLSTKGTSNIIIDAAVRYDAVAMHYCKTQANGSSGPCYDGSFTLDGNHATFAGDPTVLEGLVQAGGTLNFINSVPEPSTWALTAAGVVLLVARRRKPGGDRST